MVVSGKFFMYFQNLDVIFGIPSHFAVTSKNSLLEYFEIVLVSSTTIALSQKTMACNFQWILATF